MRLRLHWTSLMAVGSVLAALALPRTAPNATAAPLPVAPVQQANAPLASATRYAAATLGRRTRASAPQSGSASSDFHEVAAQGFGDRSNSEAWSMAWFNNHLFVGTARDLQCFKDGAAYLGHFHNTYPSTDTNLLCPSSPFTQPTTLADLPPDLGAQVWEMTPTITPPITQANWGLAYKTPLTDTFILDTHPVTGPRDMGFRGMSVFTDTQHPPTLFISGVSMDSLQDHAPPPGLLYTTDGTSYTAAPSDPGTIMGDINAKTKYCCLRDSIEYNGKFYIAVTNFGGAGTVYVSSSPRDGDNAFSQFTPTYPVTMAILAMAVFNGQLYLGGSTAKGYQVWQYNGQPCPQQPQPQPCPRSDFIPMLPLGGGLGTTGNRTVLSMQVFTDTLGAAHLYVGTDGTSTGQPTEIVRINADGTWDLIVGNPRTLKDGTAKAPLSQLPAGFGWPYNLQMWRMGVYDGTLYVGTFDSSTALTSTVKGALLQQLIPKMGFDLYATQDGTTFTRVTDNGFGDPFSWGARTFQDTPYGLFVGSNNLWYGLRIWQGGLSPSGEALAAQGLVAQRGPQNVGIALSWTAPSSAVSFTVYRATLAKQTISGTSAWIETQDMPITTTTAHGFWDTSAISGTSYFYNVVAQDAKGDLSEPSNEVSSSMARVLVPSMGVTPLNGTVGSTATVTGTSFGSNEPVNVYWDNQAGPLLATAATSGAGAFTVTITIPPSGHGYHNVIVQGQRSQLSVSVPYYVMPSAVLSPTLGPVGTQATVSGLGFTSGDTITVSWDGLGGPVLVSGTADVSGSFTLPFTVPPAAFNAYPIDVTGQMSATHIIQYFTVEPSLTIAPISGTAGTTATLTGTGFSGLVTDTIHLLWNCDQGQGMCHGPGLGPTLSDQNGNFSATVTIPATATVGTYPVAANDPAIGRLVTTAYTVTG